MKSRALFIVLALILSSPQLTAGKRNRIDTPLTGGWAIPGPSGAELQAARETERRVVNLPEDGEHWWTTLILDAKWQSFPNQVKAHSMMTNDAACAQLMEETRGRIITTTAPIAKPYFRYITGTPCLVIQNPQGQVIYSEVNPDLGRRPRELINEINQTMRRKKHCDGNVCPIVDPGPQPAPGPQPDGGPVDVPVQPAVVTPIVPVISPPLAEKTSPAGALLAFFGIGALAYAVKFGIAAHTS